MARTGKPLPIGTPEMTARQSVEVLTKKIEDAQKLISSTPTEDSYDAWKLATENLLHKAFGRNHPSVDDVTQRYQMSFGDGDIHDWSQYYRDRLKAYCERLKGAIELFETDAKLQEASAAASNAAIGNKSTSASKQTFTKVFVVHGRDDAAKSEVARFLDKLKLTPVILHEQPNKGHDILNKLIANSLDVGFAICLLTPDDKGGLAKDETLEPRARQNVVFELGFFIGKLGRENVCALVSKGVERPSDYVGPVYIELDAGGGWHLPLAKELRAAGYTVDFNNL